MKKETIVWLSQRAYGICIIAMGIKQLVYGHFDANFLPHSFSSNLIYQVLAYPWGVAFTLSGIAFLLDKKVYETALLSGGIFLGLMLFVQIPFVLLSSHRNNLLMWSAVVQCSSFAGSSFILAASTTKNSPASNKMIQWLEYLVPQGRIFFSLMMITYGTDHFIYVDLVSTMVPSWIPYHLFWTYLTGAALIGAGVAIIGKIKTKIVASLFGVMLFIWFLIIHIPTAMADPHRMNGLELNRVFVTFGFTGIAFLIAFANDRKLPR